MGRRGPHSGSLKERPRNETGQFLPVITPAKSVSADIVIASIEKNFGLKTVVAREVELDLRTIFKYAEELAEVKRAFWGQEERVLDMAEMQLYSAVQKGQAWAICFLLKTKGKGRGYIERVENDGRFAFLGLNASVNGGGKEMRQRGDFDTEGYIELFRGFFDRAGDGVPTSDGAHEPLDTGNADP